MKSCGIGLLVFLLAGCTTLNSQRRSQALRRDNDLSALKAHVAKLENRVNDIEGARRRMYEENDALRAEIKRESEKLRAELTAVQDLVKAVEKARARDRQKLVDEIVAILSKRVSVLLREHQPAPAYQTGREHTVQQGETLSEIARAYGVTVKAIVRANKQLKSEATIIRPGQKLFIPE